MPRRPKLSKSSSDCSDYNPFQKLKNQIPNLNRQDQTKTRYHKLKLINDQDKNKDIFLSNDIVSDDQWALEEAIDNLKKNIKKKDKEQSQKSKKSNQKSIKKKNTKSKKKPKVVQDSDSDEMINQVMDYLFKQGRKQVPTKNKQKAQQEKREVKKIFIQLGYPWKYKPLNYKLMPGSRVEKQKTLSRERKVMQAFQQGKIYPVLLPQRGNLSQSELESLEATYCPKQEGVMIPKRVIQKLQEAQMVLDLNDLSLLEDQQNSQETIERVQEIIREKQNFEFYYQEGIKRVFRDLQNKIPTVESIGSLEAWNRANYEYYYMQLDKARNGYTDSAQLDERYAECLIQSGLFPDMLKILALSQIQEDCSLSQDSASQNKTQQRTSNYPEPTEPLYNPINHPEKFLDYDQQPIQSQDLVNQSAS